MRYQVRVSSVARRNLQRINSQSRARVEAAIYRLGSDAYPRGSVKLKGQRGRWRIRIGRFRVIYEVYDDVLIVVVVRVALRNEGTYRG